jgi:hypothetical protein
LGAGLERARASPDNLAWPQIQAEDRQSTTAALRFRCFDEPLLTALEAEVRPDRIVSRAARMLNLDPRVDPVRCCRRRSYPVLIER